MLTELSQLRELLDKSHKPKKLILAASEDAHSLNAVVDAAREKIIRPILVGDREKTGVFTGSYVRNPATGESVPLSIDAFAIGQNF